MVDGLTPKRVEKPSTAEEVAEVLRAAAEADQAVVPVGGGRALGLGDPLERFDVALETRGLNRVIEMSQADMTVSIEAGVTVEELNAELADGFEPVAMHIGINTGPASLGTTKIEGRAGTRWTYTASGMTTNLAARLAAVAEGGEIIVSAATHDRLVPLIECEDLGERMLKNVDHPIRLFRVA